jgi:hypothetical protein
MVEDACSGHNATAEPRTLPGSGFGVAERPRTCVDHKLATASRLWIGAKFSGRGLATGLFNLETERGKKEPRG